ncbi:hypothetical protein Mgra_00004482 [Meloidogyne graminicola]|uniref:Cep192/Spd-2-like domain-containing protein n=1 Tax=Meloidogyne graminicola TaxID=189291 RepID=A0A8S9ZS62_9BILA|nr:hypothetical protein Mgra_00004482 [Meloidogyne graminicola]
MKNDLNTSIGSGKLSIPSQQGVPPKHSTPNRPDWKDERIPLEQSTICDEFEHKSSISTTTANYIFYSLQKPPEFLSEKDFLSNFIQIEFDKKRHSSMKEGFNNYINTPDLPRDISNNGLNRKIPKFDSPACRPISSASDTDSLASLTRKSLLGVEQDKSMLNFGYVSIGESLTLKQKIWNCDNEQMRIKCSILLDENVEQEEECFKITNVSTPIMRPGEWCEICVQYTPTKVERNAGRLVIDRENGIRFRYSFSLYGVGGGALLSLDINFEAGIAFESTSGRVIVIKPDTFSRQHSFPLIAIDRRGNILSRENVLIRVDETFAWISDNDNIGIKSNKTTPKHEGEQVGDFCGGRDSILSSASTSSFLEDCAFQILSYWGEEGQRQRIKWLIFWEKAFKPFYLNGFRFTGKFENEKEFTAEQKRKAHLNVKEEDAKEFKNLLRILKFNIIDERANLYFPTQQDAIQPVLDMYKNQSILLRENEESSYYNTSNSQMFLSSNGRARIQSTSSSGSTVPNTQQKPMRIFSGRDQQNKKFM